MEHFEPGYMGGGGIKNEKVQSSTIVVMLSISRGWGGEK